MNVRSNDRRDKIADSEVMKMAEAIQMQHLKHEIERKRPKHTDSQVSPTAAKSNAPIFKGRKKSITSHVKIRNLQHP